MNNLALTEAYLTEDLVLSFPNIYMNFSMVGVFCANYCWSIFVVGVLYIGEIEIDCF